MNAPGGETLEERIEREVEARFALSGEAFAARVRRRLGAEADRARLWLDDLYLATSCSEGDESAWRELERRHFDYVRSFARRFGLPDHAAGDVAEGVIADLWGRRALASYGGRSALRTWLGALVTNAALNERARERRAAARDVAARQSDEALHGSAAGASDPDQDAVGGALVEAVREALGEVPAGERLLVRLHYADGLSLDAIGAIEGVSKATLSRALKRIRERLRGELERALGRRGLTWSEVRESVAIERVELDLPALLGEPAQRTGAPHV